MLDARRLGAALAASSAPGAIYAAWWSGVGDARWHVWLLAVLIAALIGLLTWPVFIPDERGSQRPGAGFAALFSASVGMLAGAITAFPMGAVFGFVSGLVGGAVTALMWSLLAARPPVFRGAVSASTGGLVALLGVAWWLA